MKRKILSLLLIMTLAIGSCFSVASAASHSSDICKKAKSYAWTSVSMAKKKPKPAYKVAHKKYMRGDSILESSDRAVAVVMRSIPKGDKSYPAGACTNQLKYMQKSKKYKRITNGYKAGDIFSSTGHCFIYIGNSKIYSASYLEKYPNIQHEKIKKAGKGIFKDSNGFKYQVYRYVK